MTALRSADDLLAPAVAETLNALELQPEDAGAARLAETYAKALDRASAIEAAADRVLRKANDEDPELAELVSALKGKLAAATTLRELGPKLHDVLTALGANPKGRAALSKGGAPRGKSKLDQLREARGA